MTASPWIIRQACCAALLPLIGAILGVGCDHSDFAGPVAPSPFISPGQYALSVGDTLRIRATYNGWPCDCLWASTNETRAAIDASGVVHALAPGWVTIIATYRRDVNAKASALVDVVAP